MDGINGYPTSHANLLKIWLPLIETATGSEVYTRRLADGLRQRGHEVTLSTVPHRFQYAPWLAPISPPPATDVTLANSWNAAAFDKRGVPLVSVCHLVVHDPILTPYKSSAQKAFHKAFVRPMERRAVRSATRNIAVSHSVAQQMRTYLGADEIEVILNGVDTEFFHPIAVPKHECLRLVFIGKPSLRKGFDTVARILSRLGDSVHFTCVGAPPSKGLPRPEGIYLGPQDRAGVRDAMQNADLLLFPSRMEGCSLVVTEAMACGLPVVGCLDTSVSEIVPDEAGIMRHPDDVDGFADRIRELAANRGQLANMRRSARRHVETCMSEEVWLNHTEAVLSLASKSAS